MANVPIYAVDPLVRRGVALQKTRDARPPVVRISGEMMNRLGLEGVDTVRVTQMGQEAVLPLVRDDRVVDGVAWIPAAQPAVMALPDMFGPVTLEAAK